MYVIDPTITFDAPMLPDGVFMDNVAVSVNRIGNGPESNNETAVISKYYNMLWILIHFIQCCLLVSVFISNRYHSCPL